MNKEREVVEDMEAFLQANSLTQAANISQGQALVYIIRHERNTRHTRKTGQVLFKPQLIPCVVDKVMAQDVFVLLGEKRLRKQVKQSSLYVRGEQWPRRERL